jgi:ligand-binding sensor domain-containing protein
VYALAFDPRQNIILAATSEGLWVCQGDSVKHQEDPALEGAGRLCAITVGSDKYWIGSEIGVLEYGTGPTLVRTPGEQDLPEATITCLAMDGQNRLWAGTASGVWTFDNHKWLHLQPPGSLTTPIVNVNQIVNTPGDIVWLGSWQAGREGGLRRFRSSVELPLARPGAPRTVDALALDTAGQLWVASGENLFRQVDATWQTQPGPDANKLFLCLLSDRNNQLWCGMKGCLYFQEGAGWLKILDQHDILAVAEDAEGVIWIGTSQGLYTYKSKKLKAADIHLPSSRVQALCLTGTDIWIGTAAGLVRLKQGQASYWDPGNSGLVGPSIKALALGADNILWVGTNLGVCQFKFMEE